MRLINIGILAHVDAGKTTTVEQMLYLSGSLRTLGSVNKGSTQTDFLAVERERGISVSSASVILNVEGVRINIIDTPGHMDFTGEVERALSVLDGAVLVVSASEGIQSQTERFWKSLREMKIPTLIFLNKLDRVGCAPGLVLSKLQSSFSPKIIPINHYRNSGETNLSVEPHSITDDALLDLCENDPVLAEQYLETGALSPSEIETALIRQTHECLAFPLVYGAAALGIGIYDLITAVRTFMPAQPIAPEGEPMGIVYKIEHDKAAGKIAHIRLFEGTIRNRDVVTLYRPGAATEPLREKITQIRRVSGAKRENIGLFSGNEIAAVYGMTGVKVGDTVGCLLERRNTRLTEPLFSVRLYGQEGKETQLMQAISELSDEDPLMDYTWNHEARELVINIMGYIQLEILEYLLLERYGLTVAFSPPTVIYKETPASQGIGVERYTMPKPCWAVVHLQMDPMPRGSGYLFESAVHVSTLSQRYQNHIETAIPQTLKQGRLGWEVTDLKVTLTNGEEHKFHTHPLDFFLATPIAVMKALENAGSVLLEPLTKLRLTADETLAGRLIGDIIEMRGIFDSPVIKNSNVEIEAIVPVASSMDYAVKFASLTSGCGIISSDYCGYKDCPPELGKVAKRRGIDPLDRAKWILHKRGALS